MVVHACNPSYLGDRGRRISIWGQPGQKQETLSDKQTKKQKRTGVIAPVIGPLPHKHKTLSILSTVSIPWVYSVLWKRNRKFHFGVDLISYPFIDSIIHSSQKVGVTQVCTDWLMAEYIECEIFIQWPLKGRQFWHILQCRWTRGHCASISPSQKDKPCRIPLTWSS
jgi:hypothetical protein